MAPAHRPRADVLARPLRAARSAPAPGTGSSRTDLRQIRPDALDAARPDPTGHRRRAGQAAGSRAAVPHRAGDRDPRAPLRQAGRTGFQNLRARTGGKRFGRASPSRRAAGRHPRRGEGPAPGYRGHHRERPRADADGGVGGRNAVARRQTPAAARGRRRVRQDDSRRARPRARSRQLLAAAAQLPAFTAAPDPRGVLGLVEHRGNGHGADGRHADRAGGSTPKSAPCASRSSTGR